MRVLDSRSAWSYAPPGRIGLRLLLETLSKTISAPYLQKLKEREEQKKLLQGLVLAGRYPLPPEMEKILGLPLEWQQKKKEEEEAKERERERQKEIVDLGYKLALKGIPLTGEVGEAFTKAKGDIVVANEIAKKIAELQVQEEDKEAKKEAKKAEEKLQMQKKIKSQVAQKAILRAQKEAEKEKQIKTIASALMAKKPSMPALAPIDKFPSSGKQKSKLTQEQIQAEKDLREMGKTYGKKDRYTTQ